MTNEEILKLDNNEVENVLNDILKEISNISDYGKTVFETSCIYFIITKEKILEIPNDASCGPKGGWFPDIINGLSQEQNDYIKSLMQQYDIDEYFFDDFLDYTGAVQDCIEECIDEYINELEDDNTEIFFSVYETIKMNESEKYFPFSNISELIWKFNRFGLEKDYLYYEWDRTFINLYDNICDVGENKGTYDNHSERDWLYILTNLDKYIVKTIN